MLVCDALQRLQEARGIVACAYNANENPVERVALRALHVDIGSLFSRVSKDFPRDAVIPESIRSEIDTICTDVSSEYSDSRRSMSPTFSVDSGFSSDSSLEE